MGQQGSTLLKLPKWEKVSLQCKFDGNLSELRVKITRRLINGLIHTNYTRELIVGVINQRSIWVLMCVSDTKSEQMGERDT